MGRAHWDRRGPSAWGLVLAALFVLVALITARRPAVIVLSTLVVLVTLVTS
jgi:hypothetical protein